MSKDLDSIYEAEQSMFRPFTRESLATIEARKTDETINPKERKKKRAGNEVRYDDERLQPDGTLEQGLPLPMRMQDSFPPELTSTPIEDIDPFYHNQRTFVVISKSKYIFRFSATNALWIIDPFSPIRRAAINILVHPLFPLFIITTILVNCIFMVMPTTPAVESAEIVFIGIYTLEFAVKVIARGFILQPFTYLRDAWNWLDFILIMAAYLTLYVDLENMAVLRTFRVLRALKTVAIVPGLRTIAGAVTESIKNLGDAVILVIFSLFVFALMGLQIYMGILTQKCIKVFPEDGSWGNLTDEKWERFCQNETNWYEDGGEYPLCGNSSGAGQCEPGYVCLQGYGPNPNYGYTNFDTFGWAFLSAFRLMTQDYWESLYQMVLRSAGLWHVLFFVMVIFLGSFYLVNLILAIVVLSYDKLQKKVEEEKKAEEDLKEVKTTEPRVKAGKDVKPANNNPFTEQPRRQSRGDQQAEDEDHTTTTFKQRLLKYVMNGIDFFCIWDCCWLWLKFQKCIATLVFDPFFELFIMLCIIMNTLFMALDHHDIDKDMETFLRSSNYFFVMIFAIEAILKLIAMSPKYYFQERWNVFDFTIVASSFVELILEGVQGLSILRSLRVLRIFRLAKSWPTLNLLFSIMGRTMDAFVSLTFVLWIIIFIFAVLGMQLYGKNYVDNIDRFPDEVIPRWNFTDFLHSFMIVFRVLCGEWIESMWDCMLVGDVSCIPFFLATVVICNLVVLNLFLALFLSNFASPSFSSLTTNQDTNKIAEAFNRISRFMNWLKRNVAAFMKLLKNKMTDQKETENQLEVGMDLEDSILYNDKNLRDEVNVGDGGKLTKPVSNIDKMETFLTDSINTLTDNHRNNRLDSELHQHEYPIQVDTVSQKYRTSNIISLEGKNLKGSTTTIDGEEKKDTTKEELGLEEGMIDDEDKGINTVLNNINKNVHVVNDTPAECCPKQCYKCFPFFTGDNNSTFWHAWATLRLKTCKLIENRYFETAVIIVILLSSLALTLEDIHLQHRPLLRKILYHMDFIFTVLFLIEMLIKCLALGFRKYFTNAWCWLDFIVILLSVINRGAVLAGAGDIASLRTIRTLRALRPLCVVSRSESMRVVVSSLAKTIPSILNVLFVCLYFWLIFAIIGVQLFAGKYFKCVDMNRTILSHEIIPDRKSCILEDYIWENSPMNFDDVGKAYLSLFQVATFKGWLQIMYDATDSTEVGRQPIRETNIYMYLYFIFFIIFGSFFIRYLLISVIINNFKEQKKKTTGSLEMFMTEDQKKYYNAIKKIKSKTPLKTIPKPKWRPQAKVFEIVTNKKFDLLIMLLIGLNMITLAFDHYQQSDMLSLILDYFNMIFILIFTAECLLKIFGLRYHYFIDPWNLYDFFVVVLSILNLVLSDTIEKYFVSPILLRILRVAKIGRVLQLVKGAKGIRTLLHTLAMSVPALLNICFLLFLVMFIFAIFGMSLFMHVKNKGGIDDVYNFKTFGQSMILLFQVSTSAGWDGVLEGIINEEECELPNNERGSPGNCGSATIGIPYLLSYLVITYFIIINMYIAIIFENYKQATEDVQEGLTDDDYDMYYEIWQRFDPDGSQYIRYDQLSDFLDMLKPPLQIRKPNNDQIKAMDIPICRGGVVFYLDILETLTKDFFARKNKPIEKKADEVEEADEPSYEPVSTRLFKPRNEFSAH